MTEDNLILKSEDSSSSSSMEDSNYDWLCGAEGPAWNSSQFWHASHPEFGSCFRQTAWSFPPCFCFWLLLPYLLAVQMRKTDARSVPLSVLHVAKAAALVVLVVLATVDLGYAVLRGEEITMAGILDPTARLSTFLIALLVSHFQRQRGHRISGIHWTFFLVFTVTSLLPLYDIVLKGMDNPDSVLTLTSISTLASITFILLSFVLHFFAEPPATYGRPAEEAPAATDKIANECPEVNASFPSKICFSWFTGLAWTGFKRDLTSADLWDLVPYMHSRVISKRFERFWNSGRSGSGGNKDNSSSNGKNGADAKNGSVAFTGKKEELEFKPKEEKQPQPQRSVVKPLFQTFGWTFLAGSVLKLTHDLLLFVSPYLLKLIIQFASQDTEGLWKGIVYCVLILAASSAQTILLSYYFYQMYLIGMKIRSALTSTVYRKSLKAAATAKEDATTGELVNLMSVDIQRLVDMMPYLNMIWSAPVQIFGSIFFLWRELGPSVLAGLLVMVLLIPVNGAIAAKSRQFQMQQMKKKDQRIKIMNEILQGIKILKLHAWEPSFQKMVTNIRDEEIFILKKMGYLAAGTSFIWSCAPFLVSLVSFATFVLVDENNILDSEKAFVSLSLFNILRFPLSMLPMMIAMLVQSSVSVKRLNKFMNAEEIDSGVEHNRDGGANSELSVSAKEATFSWNADQKTPTLSSIDLDIKKGSLVAVVGTVGAGKSSLLSALLGEMKKTSGSVTVWGDVAFVAQQAFIQNATVKENITFGQSYEKERYDSIVAACALKPDLEVLQAGDATEIGEKGINLSGGQKQRVSLARAVYNRSADLFLLDDPLSAVDSHVAKHIFEKVIGPEGMLAGKTRVLVTHGMTFLPKVDLIVVVKDGAISESGTYLELLARKGAFAEILMQYITEVEKEAEDMEEVGDLKEALEEALGAEELKKSLMIARQTSIEAARKNSLVEEEDKKSLAGGGSIHSNNSLTRKRKKSQLSNKEVEEAAAKEKKDQNKQYQEEKAESGQVKGTVYLYYLLSMGVWLCIGCFLSFTVYQICSAYSSIWLAHWADESSVVNGTSGDLGLYLGVYAGLGLGQVIFAVFGSICLYLATLQGAKTLHHLVLSNILRSPMLFFDTTPQGRILNRFSKDVDVLDATMPMILRGWVTCLLAVISTFVIITYTTPLFLAPVTVVLVCYFLIQRVYVASSRQLKRLESITRSPIYSHFGETINGALTIRAYNLQDQFIRESERRVDENQRALFPSNVANRWLSVRLETVGNLIIFCSALFAVLGKDEISPGLVGLSVSYALSVTQTLNWLVRMASEVETNIVAVERLKEYAETKQEAKWEPKEDVKPFAPTEGKIEFCNYSTRYREGLSLVLSDVTFTVEGGERVGIVGRTGAGKSSLTLALFRLIEPVTGNIKIDGVDTATLGLHELRSKLSIIPQEPVLFSGTLRMNLDPFEQHSEEEVKAALQHAHLGEFLGTLEEGLGHKITEGGSNLSVGQRQLVCLARAMLAKSKVLILDEATAAVDVETDEIIQKTIREEFSDTTIITIAHRLNTIMDYSKIVVLTSGTVAEHDTPAKLMANRESLFYQMCAEAGITA